MDLRLKRNLIVSFSIIFGSAIIAALTLYFLEGNAAATAAKIVADKALIDKESGSLAVYAALKQQAPIAAAYQTALEKLLPGQDGLIGFSQWFSSLAAAHQVSAAVSFAGAVAPPSDTAPGQAGFSFSASGSVNDLAAFLEDVQSKAPGFFVQISTFDLTRQDTGYQMTGQGQIFFRKT